MIDIQRLSLSFNNQTVLNIKDLKLEKNGLYALVGPSGCGKTTLINVLSGAIKNFYGTVFVNGVNIQTLHGEEELKYRQTIVSTCYQNHIVFDDLTVYENINLKLDFFRNISRKAREFQIREVLRRLNIAHLRNTKAKYLSGGEKQRLSIGRAIINQAKIIIFDEPTAALDDENAHLVFDYIKEMAHNSIIIVVTHNLDLVNLYADQVFTLNYGKIEKCLSFKNVNEARETYKLEVSKPQQATLFSKIKLGFKLFKSRQRRNFFVSSVLSSTLTAVCALLLVTTSVSKGIKASFSNNFDTSTAYISYQKKTPYPYFEGANYAQVQQLAAKYDAKVGGFYLNQLDTLFPNANDVYFSSSRHRFALDEFHISHFNFVTLLEEVDKKAVFGFKKNVLQNDEVILMLPPRVQKQIYEELGLRKGLDLSRLGEYLQAESVTIQVHVANDSWGYEDDQIFKVVGVISGDATQIIHTNVNFPTYVFEEQLSLPISLKYSSVDDYPWTLKKMFFLYKKENDAILIDEIWNPSLLLARLGESLIPGANPLSMVLNNRIVITKKSPTYMRDINRLGNRSLYLTTNIGLTVFPDALMIGFSDHFFISPSKAQLEEVISYDERVPSNEQANVLMGPKMIDGLISLSLNDGLRFKVVENVHKGREPSALNEIVLSQSLFVRFFDKPFLENEEYILYIATPSEVNELDEEIIKNYVIVEMRVVGIIKYNKDIIYHQSYWPLLFYKDMIKVNPFNLIPTGIVSDDPKVIASFQTLKDYEITYPFRSFVDTIDTSLNQMVNIIYIGAFSALLMTMIVIFLSIKTLLDDLREQLTLLCLFGYSKWSIITIILSNITIMMAISILSAVVSTIIIQLTVIKQLFADLPLSFNGLPFLLTVFIAFLCVLPALILMILRIKSVQIIDLMKNNL